MKKAYLIILLVSLGAALTLHFGNFEKLISGPCETATCEELTMEQTVINAAYSQSDVELMSTIDTYLQAGGDIDHQTQYGETLLGVTFRFQKMTAFRHLIALGADSASLGWPDGFMELALGDSKASELPVTLNPEVRNDKGLTPFLFAVSLRHQNMAEVLLPLTAKDGQKGGRNNYGPLVFAAQHRHSDMIDWLLSQGFDVNEASTFGETALHVASEIGAPDTVEALLNAGADVHARHNLSAQLKAFPPNYERYDPDFGADNYETIFTPMNRASDVQTARLLYRKGAPLKELSDANIKNQLIGASNLPKQAVSTAEFERHKHRIFGTANPELTNHNFWLEQIRTAADGYAGFEKYSETKRDYSKPAIWSFNRFGQSMTELPDGRWILISGEHEDSYDDDFCIYNDVIVISPDGTADIYSYPEEIFQPTDFHTATRVGDTIFIIGNLGYFGKRQEGATPVYMLSLETFEISAVETQGASPGWISRHNAMEVDGKIVISDGQVLKDGDLIDNTHAWSLSLDSYSWEKKTPSN